MLAALLLAACAPWQPSSQSRSERDARPEERTVRTPPAWYAVERGDTLYSIAFRYGLDWRRVASWNAIGAPFTIRPGQELRLSAPPSRPIRRSPTSAGNDGSVAVTSSDRTHETATEPSAPEPEPPPEPAPTSPVSTSAAEPPESSASRVSVEAGASRSVGGVAWQWPTAGSLARSFDPAATRKGIGIAGDAGQDVRAAASGQVVYSGTALIGYGELIIIKHSDVLLSAYGHNRRRLVGEGDRVERGQKIAEMGLDDRQEELLHFEIRRNGEPVNPLDFLPRR